MYRDYKVRLKMSMFRPIKQVENYIKNENNNTNISKRKDIVFR